MKTQKFKEKYPELFRDCWECSVGDGWAEIIERRLPEIDAIRLTSPDLKIEQVKEKFGGLRFYTCGTASDVDFEALCKIEREMEKEADQTCEYCGSKTDVSCSAKSNHNWIKTLCQQCHEGKTKREEALDELAKEAQDLDLGY